MSSRYVHKGETHVKSCFIFLSVSMSITFIYVLNFKFGEWIVHHKYLINLEGVHIKWIILNTNGFNTIRVSDISIPIIFTIAFHTKTLPFKVCGFNTHVSIVFVTVVGLLCNQLPLSRITSVLILLACVTEGER